MKKLFIMMTAVLLLLGLAACTPDGQIENEQDTQTPNEQQQENLERPATKTDVITLEGMDEEFEFNLYEDKGLGFSTYISEDMIAESVSTGEGDALIVYANFGGNKNEDAALSFFSPSEAHELNLEQLIEQTKEQLTNEGYKVEELEESTNPLQLDVQIYNLESSDLIGKSMFFEHQDRVYVIYYHYPPEFGDGFGPRLNKLLEDIVWY